MPVTSLSTPYHQQDTDYYCGAACAQMVLDSIGAGLLDQAPLYTDNHSHSTREEDWYTGPDGLKWTMNHRRPPGFASDFELFALAREATISRKIVWTIHHHGVAPIALVEGSDHWIVVRGYDANADPTKATDASYTINGFYLNNPWPPPDSAPPPPHSNTTDGCGTGDDRGIANEHVTYVTWQDTYMTGVPLGHWSGKFLAVCDPDPPESSERPEHESGHVARRESPYRGDGILPPSGVAKLALGGMREHHLLEQRDWSEALSDAHPDEPLLVQRLDRGDSFYYLVPLRSQAGPMVVASVDALFGDYRQAAIVTHPGEFLYRGGDRDRLLERLDASRPVLEGLRGGGIVLRRETLSVSPSLVWRPCRESLSPFYPFHVITIGARRLYYRVDGRLFTRLTPAGRGL